MRAVWVVFAVILSACTSSGSGTTAPTPTTQPAGPTSTSPGPSAGASSSSSSGASSITCWTAPAAAGSDGISFEIGTEGFGLVDPLDDIKGHAGAFGDVDGDGWVDLFVGTFANRPVSDYQVRGAAGPGPDRVLLHGGEAFADAGVDFDLGRTSGAVFADLDLDGDLDLVVSRNTRPGQERGDAASVIYRNDGGTLGFEAVLADAEGGRSIGVIDIDSDGLPDLILLEDRWSGGSSVVYRNLGELRFEDATTSFGFPPDVHGLGIGTADLDGDGVTDVVVGGSNRVFLGTGSGLAEVPGVISDWEVFTDEDDVAGVSIADVTGDGLADIVLGQHYNSTLSRDTRVPVRLYVNRSRPGEILFEDVTEAAGLVGLPTKAPHAEFVDLDNDGLVDIITSAAGGDGSLPAVFRNEGIQDGIPRFEPPSGLGSAQYWVALPTADIDRDGRVDVFGVEWETALQSPLFRNTSSSGHWLEVAVDESLGGGPGTSVEVYATGGAGDPSMLLGAREISVSQGYSAGNEAAVHIGLGSSDRVDVVVTPPGGPPITLGDIAADRRIRLPDGC